MVTRKRCRISMVARRTSGSLSLMLRVRLLVGILKRTCGVQRSDDGAADELTKGSDGSPSVAQGGGEGRPVRRAAVTHIKDLAVVPAAADRLEVHRVLLVVALVRRLVGEDNVAGRIIDVDAVRPDVHVDGRRRLGWRSHDDGGLGLVGSGGSGGLRALSVGPWLERYRL